MGPIQFVYVCLRVHSAHICACAHMWRPEENFQEQVLHHMDLRGQTRVTRLGGNHLYPVNHLTDPTHSFTSHKKHRREEPSSLSANIQQIRKPRLRNFTTCAQLHSYSFPRKSSNVDSSVSTFGLPTTDVTHLYPHTPQNNLSGMKFQ